MPNTTPTPPPDLDLADVTPTEDEAVWATREIFRQLQSGTLTPDEATEQAEMLQESMKHRK